MKNMKNQQLIIQVILTKKIETKERDFFLSVLYVCKVNDERFCVNVNVRCCVNKEFHE